MSTTQSTSPACLGPRATTAPRRLRVPAGAWDTHAHVIGGGPDFPFVANRSYTPPAATPAQHAAMLDATGMAYGVLVQVSVHGIDNSLLVKALRERPGRLRGVAVIDADMTDAALLALRDAGVTGIRVNELFSGGGGAGDLAGLGARCAALGWHIQLALHGTRIRELKSVIERLKVPVVIDHMGWCAASAGVNQPDFQAVLSLVRDAGCWVKLSGAYRMSAQAAPYWDAAPDTNAALYADAAPFAQALAAAAPDRLLWGSDWPHVALTDPAAMPQPGALLDVLYEQLHGDESLLHAVLTGNPPRLYGMPVP